MTECLQTASRKLRFADGTRAYEVVPVGFVWLWGSPEFVCLNVIDSSVVDMARGCVSKACSDFS